LPAWHWTTVGYPVTVAVLTPDSYGVEAKVWLPTP
jgi:hypothetical protein